MSHRSFYINLPSKLVGLKTFNSKDIGYIDFIATRHAVTHGLPVSGSMEMKMRILYQN
jgi:hypothetical protein